MPTTQIRYQAPSDGCQALHRTREAAIATHPDHRVVAVLATYDMTYVAIRDKLALINQRITIFQSMRPPELDMDPASVAVWFGHLTDAAQSLEAAIDAAWLED